MTNCDVVTELTTLIAGEIRFLGFLLEGKQIPAFVQTILKQRKVFLNEQLEKLLIGDLVKHQ